MISPFSGRGPLLLDGGLATALEAKGFDLDDPLWSARLLIEAPDAIREVHTDFLEAGADVIATVSYQASLPGFAARGIGREEGVRLLELATRLAVEARDAFRAGVDDTSDRRRPLVAASVGPYGAYLADGSEYRGDYGVGRDELYDFHRARWHLFAEGEADLIACETIPSALEAEVLLDLLGETHDAHAWISFSCPDGRHISDGARIADVAARCDGTPNLVALGVNCTKPRHIASLIGEIRSTTDLPILVYPNAGEEYDAETRSWVEVTDEGRGAAALPELARGWLEAGASGVGGCCRVSADDIRALDRVLRG
ncbi:MAG TPA: homocysteine S-methyltransferase [Longimicrobiales bacterium]|nr:homocysteine S-methyltransferase [Longimicrobiales bacterium]